MPFFIKRSGGSSSKDGKKRKNRPNKNRIEKRKKSNDEEIFSDGSDIEGAPDAGYESKDEEQIRESAEEKRLRLAKVYLEEIEREENERLGVNRGQELNAAINERLRTDQLELSGKLRRCVAENITPGEMGIFRDHKGHKLSLTCAVVSPNGQFIYTGSKDAGLVKWTIKGVKQIRVPKGRGVIKEGLVDCHYSCVNALAISCDGNFLASGDDSKLIHIWDPNTLTALHTFRGHRDIVSGLAFRRKTHTLYSCSYDRSVKIWNLDEMGYVETLFGHQDRITGIDAGIRERAITSGGRDGSVRVWKIVEESQLVFNAPTGYSTDGLALINEEYFITAGEDGHLALWCVTKKKPLFIVSQAHGVDVINGEANWISSITALPMTDLVATGSSDGFIRLWHCGQNFRRLNHVKSIPQVGFVNGLAFAFDGSFMVAAVGQEHRLGRWWRQPEAKNSLMIIHFQESSTETLEST